VQSLALSVFFVLLMSPPSPLSTLFPYTTLFRSVARRRPGAFGGIRARVAPTGHARRSDPGDISIATRPPSPATPHIFAPVDRARSEEHTSELQSLRHLVCRLLLEKKKKM